MEQTYQFKPEQKAMPVKSFKAGALQIAIWENQSEINGQPQSYKTVSFDRRYKDKDGNWKSTSQLRLNDLPKAALILNEAYKYLVLTEPNE
ncbi:MAG: hypothetical protein OXR66_03855 [Candidatus Woesearchaeota archaeon]|nr:hypothetical protein [Candidatus Woesearchaeota archaeon]